MNKPTVERLREIPVFEKVPTDQIEWLIEKGTVFSLKDGEYLFRRNEPVNHLQIVINGELKLYAYLETGRKFVNSFGINTVTGILPFSRMKTAMGDGIAFGNTDIFRLDRQCIFEMIRSKYDLTEALVHHMTARVRDFAQLQTQNEKLMALGKMSAGLAHELNNPASAMARSAKELKKHLSSVPNKFKAVIRIDLTNDEIDAVNNLLHQKISAKKPSYSLLERSDLEDDLLDFLEDHDVIDPEDLIPSLIEFGFDTTNLEFVYEICGDNHFNPVIHWVVSNLTSEKMVQEIGDAAERISTLVQSVKSFSYMDRNQDFQKVNIHEGIQNTLQLLHHKIQKRGHQLDLELDSTLPEIEALPGELNQVWMNILSNAIDAMGEEKGVLKVTTLCKDDIVQIKIQDSGPGIPDEIQSRIFEPFFTTKKVGEGTGLGLDIVKKIIDRHKGFISVDSQPQKTIFTILLHTYKQNT